MERDFTRKLAFDQLREDYRQKYTATIIVEAAITFLKVAVILITSFYIAWRVGEPSVGGGPALLLKFCAVCLCVMIIYFSIGCVKNEKIRLEKEYKQKKNFLYFKLGE